MLKNKNFRYLWLGRLISNAGDSMYYIVLSWYILTLTNNSFWVGVVNFAIFIPNIFSFLFGHWIDTHSKKKILTFMRIRAIIRNFNYGYQYFVGFSKSSIIMYFSIFSFTFWYEYIYYTRRNDPVYHKKRTASKCSIIHVCCL
ncbi:MFS transporter [Listeria monocytogenes]|nr:MFS transporter [Listeria monocytogenes]EHD1764752.1 MFS transporter [Listeria monocytogenes]